MGLVHRVRNHARKQSSRGGRSLGLEVPPVGPRSGAEAVLPGRPQLSISEDRASFAQHREIGGSMSLFQGHPLMYDTEQPKYSPVGNIKEMVGSAYIEMGAEGDGCRGHDLPDRAPGAQMFTRAHLEMQGGICHPGVLGQHVPAGANTALYSPAGRQCSTQPCGEIRCSDQPCGERRCSTTAYIKKWYPGLCTPDQGGDARGPRYRGSGVWVSGEGNI
jgi:hypothetical protein